MATHILSARLENFEFKSVRPFKIPKMNIEALNYDELIDWEKVTITEPPMTKYLPVQDLKAAVQNQK